MRLRRRGVVKTSEGAGSRELGERTANGDVLVTRTLPADANHSRLRASGLSRKLAPVSVVQC